MQVDSAVAIRFRLLCPASLRSRLARRQELAEAEERGKAEAHRRKIDGRRSRLTSAGFVYGDDGYFRGAMLVDVLDAVEAAELRPMREAGA